jgi:hypothetical protein
MAGQALPIFSGAFRRLGSEIRGIAQEAGTENFDRASGFEGRAEMATHWATSLAAVRTHGGAGTAPPKPEDREGEE